MYAKETLTKHSDFLNRENERLRKHLIELESQVRSIKVEMKRNEQKLEDVNKALEKLGE